MRLPRVLAPVLCGLLLLALPARADEQAPGVDPAADAKAAALELAAGMRSDAAEGRTQAAQAAAGLQHPALMTPLLRLLADPELGVRLAATKTLASRTEKAERKRAAAGLAPRLARLAKRAQDREELFAVIDALDDLAQPASIKPLLDGIDLETERDEVRARLFAVANVPHKDAVERLIQFLDRGRRGPAAAQKEEARKALMYATGQRINRDPDEWRAWWRENEKTFDFAAVAAARAASEAEQAEKARRREERKAGRGRGRDKPDGETPGEGGG